MKYMGSKRFMLQNGLGKLLLDEANRSNFLYDPFCGSAAVTWFLAEKTNKRVISGDLQLYSVILANSVLKRTKRLTSNELKSIEEWISQGKDKYRHYLRRVKNIESHEFVINNRVLSANSKSKITRAYGGYYFSYAQGKLFDYMISSLPENPKLYSVCMAGLIEAASSCVASPGHTAQPLQPTERGIKFIIDSWNRNPIDYIKKATLLLANKHSNVTGIAKQVDALELLKQVGENDLVFVDPPYSGVHYSRFYHVLETIANNNITNVSGRGRYPDQKYRPVSEYSMKSKAFSAISSLLEYVADRGAKAIVTFPTMVSSNGLSGEKIIDIASARFKVKNKIIKGAFSTLGGNNLHRPARKKSEELILLLEPK